MNNKICLYYEKKLSHYKLCDFLTKETASRVKRFVSTQSDYAPTPLVSLDGLAERLNIGKIYVKDESKRMGLNAFKGVGVFYGAVRAICKELNLDIDTITYEDLIKGDLNKKIKEFTFIAATDGNHGKGLAWVANRLGCKCDIYMPKNTTDERVKAIENLGATVTVTDYNYDDTLRVVIDKAKGKGLLHIQDQAWDGYTETTNFISEGYTLIADEALEQMQQDGTERPTHIILQAGAGSFAFGIFDYYANVFKDNKPYMVIAEAHNANCYYTSVQKGKFTQITGDLETVMAGLSVGEANVVAWEYLPNIVEGYASCGDSITARGMRVLSSPCKEDKRVISGESGALGVGFLSTICDLEGYEYIREKMKLNKNSRVLLINTEGDTDPDMYKKIVWGGMFPNI